MIFPLNSRGCVFFVIIIPKQEMTYFALIFNGLFRFAVIASNRPRIGIAVPICSVYFGIEMNVFINSIFVGSFFYIVLISKLPSAMASLYFHGLKLYPKVNISESERIPGYLNISQVPPMLSLFSRIT